LEGRERIRSAVHHVPQMKLVVFKTYPGKEAAIGTKDHTPDCLLGWPLEFTQQQPRSGLHAGSASVKLPDYQSALPTSCEEFILRAESNGPDVLAQRMFKPRQFLPRCHFPEANVAGPVTRRQHLAVRAKGHRLERSTEASERVDKLPGAWIPDPGRAVFACRRHELSVRTEGTARNGPPLVPGQDDFLVGTGQIPNANRTCIG